MFSLAQGTHIKTVLDSFLPFFLLLFEAVSGYVVLAVPELAM